MRKIFLILLIGFIGPIFVHAETIVDGDLIRAQGGIDVYIVKIVPSTSSGQVEKFKRLILNPEIFNQYAHLKWENIKNVSQATLDEYTISDLVRAKGDDKVYKLYPKGDFGEKRWVKTVNDFLDLGYKWDAVYTINSFERDFYLPGEDLTAPTPPSKTGEQEPQVPARNPITINVPADYKTIQTAINAAIDGDTIVIKNGTYAENITIDKGVKLIGEFPTSVIIDGSSTDNTINITAGNNILIQRIVIKSKDKYGIYCQSENLITLTIKNSTLKDSGWGLAAEKNCQITAIDNLIYNNRNSSNTDGAGILIKNNVSYNIVSKIINNTIDDNYHGIWSENADLKVMNNIITSNVGGKGTMGSTGIYHTGTGKSDNTYNDVYGNGWDYGGDAKAGNGSIVVYPNFVWPVQRDYHLKTGTTDYSLCIDAGNPEFIYNDATYGTKSARNDMGAYGGPDNIGWNP